MYFLIKSLFKTVSTSVSPCIYFSYLPSLVSLSILSFKFSLVRSWTSLDFIVKGSSLLIPLVASEIFNCCKASFNSFSYGCTIYSIFLSSPS